MIVLLPAAGPADVAFLRMEDFEFSGLEEIFRERVFDFMVKKGKITQEVAEEMRAWPHSGFQTDFQRKIEADDRSSRRISTSKAPFAPATCGLS